MQGSRYDLLRIPFLRTRVNKDKKGKKKGRSCYTRPFLSNDLKMVSGSLCIVTKTLYPPLS